MGMAMGSRGRGRNTTTATMWYWQSHVMFFLFATTTPNCSPHPPPPPPVWCDRVGWCQFDLSVTHPTSSPPPSPNHAIEFPICHVIFFTNELQFHCLVSVMCQSWSELWYREFNGGGGWWSCLWLAGAMAVSGWWCGGLGFDVVPRMPSG